MQILWNMTPWRSMAVLVMSSILVTAVDVEEVHPCQRECLAGEAPRVCHYNFTTELYYTMSKACFDCPRNLTDCYRPHCVPADGVGRTVLTINRRIPGPSIQVCANDLVVVDVTNKINSMDVAIHWHGLHQRGTPYMDGTPGLTQCSIVSGAKFRYKFIASPAGTHFYHSHVDLQRADGLAGNLVIRQPRSLDPLLVSYQELYDYDLPDHMMVVQDWTYELAVVRIAAYTQGRGTNKPSSILVNGRGMLRGDNCAGASDAKGSTPAEVFRVQQGWRYRFRLASNDFLGCPMEVSVDNHTLTMVASDGAPFTPLHVDSFVVNSGERYDFILHANQSVGNYWIRFRGLVNCDSRWNAVRQVAVLRYEGAPEDQQPPGATDYWAMERGGQQLSSYVDPNYKVPTTPRKLVELDSLEEDDETSNKKPDLTFYLGIDYHYLNSREYNDPKYYPVSAFTTEETEHYKTRIPQINSLTLALPPVPLLLQHDQVDPSRFCNETTRPDKCLTEMCSCIYTLNIPLGSVVEFVIVDEASFVTDSTHPFHVHGYTFRVLATDRLPANTTVAQVKQMDQQGYLHRKLTRAVKKDSIAVPMSGYTVLRIVADNPGLWLTHCHVGQHTHMGMSLVLKVGEATDFPPSPRGFPTCGDFLPPI